MTKRNFGLCLHAHFYQPPRENPWIEEIEVQESAAPYENWNERIYQQCYRPNVFARVLDSKNKITDVVNNLEQISYNFGPTLLSWIQAKHPRVYSRILRADEASRQAHRGHGNAIAQVYNHMIMPLASKRDKITQVRWGIEDFRRRFARDPESIWLAETACNEETLEVLVEEGIKFIILEPHQAQSVCPLNPDRLKQRPEGPWQDVSHGAIDPKRSYRCFLKNHPGRFIDIFFYDGPISREIGFGDLAFDAHMFADRLESAKVDSAEAQLIQAATDGETFGHHRAFGERALAYLTRVELAKRNFRIFNYGEFHALHPPQWAVQLKEGENGEGTSWSCSHGVKRWKDHCGCRGGGPLEWTQHWRKPLRDSLDWLRDELTRIYEQHGSGKFKDVWAARDEYIKVILDRSDKNIRHYFEQHAREPLSKEDTVFCLKLLEMQRHAMLMYTSCGWFFSEISGIETLQILEYAARAMELAQAVSGESLEEEFLNRLAEAKSNVRALKDGRGVYEKLVRPKKVTQAHLAAFFAIGSLLDGFFPQSDSFPLYCYRMNVLYARQEEFGSRAIHFGRVKLQSAVTLEESDFMFYVAKVGLYEIRCSLKPFENTEDMAHIEKELVDGVEKFSTVDLMRKIDDCFGEKYWDLKDILVSDRVKMISLMTHEMLQRITAVYENLYDETLKMNEIYRSINLPIPEEIRYAVRHTVEKRMKDTLSELAGHGYLPKKAAALFRLVERIKSFGVTVPTKTAEEFLDRDLDERTKELFKKPDAGLAVTCLNLIRCAKKLDIKLDITEPQERLYHMLQQWASNPSGVQGEIRQADHPIIHLMQELELQTEILKKALLGSPAETE